MSGIAQVHNHVELIVVRIGGIEVGRAGGQVREFTVDEPDAMDSARIRPRGIEEREFEILQALRVLDALEVRYIQHPQARRLLALLERLIGDHQHVAGKAERVAARDAGRGRGKLVDQYRIFGMRNIDDAHAGLLPFMSQVEDAASIGPLLDRESFAPVAIAVEIVVADQNHVVGFRLRLSAERNSRDPAKTETRMRFHAMCAPMVSTYTA